MRGSNERIILFALIIILFVEAYLLISLGELKRSRTAKTMVEVVNEDAVRVSVNKDVERSLAKYYDIYRQAEAIEDSITIGVVVKMRFFKLDTADVRDKKLRNFLIEMREY